MRPFSIVVTSAANRNKQCCEGKDGSETLTKNVRFGLLADILRCEMKHLFFHVRRYAGAVVADSDFHTVAKVLRRSGDGWLVVAICCGSALPCCVKAI